MAGALDDVMVRNIGEAAMIIACIAAASDLEMVQAIHATRAELPVWTTCSKGKGVAFGDGDIVVVPRSAGFGDTKSCAVSEKLTATRYSPA